MNHAYAMTFENARLGATEVSWVICRLVKGATRKNKGRIIASAPVLQYKILTERNSKGRTMALDGATRLGRCRT